MANSNHNAETPNVRTVVAGRGIVCFESKILIVSSKKGIWHIPGGWVDGFESLPGCVMREVYEEVGINVEVGNLAFTYEYNVHAEESRFKENVHKFEFYFFCQASSSELPEWEDEDDGYVKEKKYVTINEMLTHNILPPPLTSDYAVAKLRQFLEGDAYSDNNYLNRYE